MNYRYAVYFKGELVGERTTSKHRTVALVATSRTGISLMAERDDIEMVLRDIVPDMMRDVSEARKQRLEAKVDRLRSRIEDIDEQLVGWLNLNSPRPCKPAIVGLYAGLGEARDRQMRSVKSGMGTEIVEVINLTDLILDNVVMMPSYDGQLIAAGE